MNTIKAQCVECCLAVCRPPELSEEADDAVVRRLLQVAEATVEFSSDICHRCHRPALSDTSRRLHRRPRIGRE